MKGFFKPILSVATGVLFYGCTTVDQPIGLATYPYATNHRITNLKLFSQELDNRLDRKIVVATDKIDSHDSSNPPIQTLVPTLISGSRSQK